MEEDGFKGALDIFPHDFSVKNFLPDLSGNILKKVQVTLINNKLLPM